MCSSMLPCMRARLCNIICVLMSAGLGMLDLQNSSSFICKSTPKRPHYLSFAGYWEILGRMVAVSNCCELVGWRPLLVALVWGGGRCHFGSRASVASLLLVAMPGAPIRKAPSSVLVPILIQF